MHPEETNHQENSQVRKIETSRPSSPILADDFFALVEYEAAYKVNHDGVDYIVGWVYFYHEDELNKPEKPEAVLMVVDLDGKQVKDWNLARSLKLEASKYRVEQIRRDMGLTGDVRDFEIIKGLLERVWAGEWMGQFNYGKAIYISELRELLQTADYDIWDLVSDLVKARYADVAPSSHILVPPVGPEPIKGTEEAFGHREFSSSDFGWWSCGYCKNRGDDWSNPSEYECQPPCANI